MTDKTGFNEFVLMGKGLSKAEIDAARKIWDDYRDFMLKEGAARALCEYAVAEGPCADWGWGETDHKYWLDCVDVVLTAIRIPNKAMMEAHLQGMIIDGFAEDAYTASIDALIKSGK